MAEPVTRPTGASVEGFLNSVESPARRAEGWALDALFRLATGFAPEMWGPSMVGYGRYLARYADGREMEWLATGFSPRKAQLVVYILPGYTEFSPVLARLGKHRLGKSCLYLNRLSDVDPEVLVELIRAGLADLARRRPVRPS